MIGCTIHQSNLFFVPLAEQIVSFRHPVLDPIDGVLADPDLVEMVTTCLASRYPKSSKTGRPGIAPDRLLRCCALKHLMSWSFRELETELRTNLVYRRFTRFDSDPTPSYSTFSRNFALLGPDATKKINDVIVTRSRDLGVTKGRKLRSDTTVVETNIHHPSDSTLLGDGIRVLTRCLKRLRDEAEAGAVTVVDHALSAKRRMVEITRAARSTAKASRAKMAESYRKLLDVTRDVVKRAEGALKGLDSRSIVIRGSLVKAMIQEATIRHYLPLVQKVISQTEERVFGGNHHVDGKILSLFEPHSVPIRKGKAHKPTEFGRLIRVDEVDGGIVSGYDVSDGNPADCNAWKPAIDAHLETFGRAPLIATADRGYFSAENERYAEEKGVKRVALPGRGRLSISRAKRQKERWFQRASRWRNGIEGRIAILKFPFGLERSVYKGDRGIKRHVGWAAIANNLTAIARHLRRQANDNK